MKVTVRSVGAIKQLLGQAELEMTLPEGTAVNGLLSRLAEEKGERFAPYAVEPEGPGAHAPVRIVINGRDIFPRQTKDVVLQEGDDVFLFVPIAGG